MIGRNGERRSGVSAQAARHDDDDDLSSLFSIYSSLYLFISLFLLPSLDRLIVSLSF